MKRFIAMMVAVGICGAYGLGCTKMGGPAKEEPKAPAAEKMVTPPPPPPPPPTPPAAPAGQGD